MTTSAPVTTSPAPKNFDDLRKIVGEKHWHDCRSKIIEWMRRTPISNPTTKKEEVISFPAGAMADGVSLVLHTYATHGWGTLKGADKVEEAAKATMKHEKFTFPVATKGKGAKSKNPIWSFPQWNQRARQLLNGGMRESGGMLFDELAKIIKSDDFKLTDDQRKLVAEILARPTSPAKNKEELGFYARRDFANRGFKWLGYGEEGEPKLKKMTATEQAEELLRLEKIKTDKKKAREAKKSKV